MTPVSATQGDVLNIPYPDGHFDLVFTSPPYEDCRLYKELDFKLKGEQWVEWAVPRFMECLRVCRGLVAWVVQGRTRSYRWSAAPALLMAELHHRGVHLRCPPVFHRVGIPGSGGPDWWRNDYEFIICATNGGRLPWSDNCAIGKPPKYNPGGPTTHRDRHGRRKNTPYEQTGTDGYKDGDTLTKRIEYTPPPLANPGNVIKIGGMTAGAKDDMPHASHGGRSGEVLPDGSIRRRDGTIYTGPEAPNPGNVLKVAVGGGKMGSKIAHENEAPFPEALVEPFVKCFCPPDGIVCDPMMGSGTTLAVAHKCGRGAVGMDIRPSQVLLTARRLKSIGAL